MNVARLLVVLALLLPSFAHAQANFLFNGGGAVIATGSSLAAQQAVVGTGLTWSAGTAGTVATVTGPANGALMNVGGQQIRMTGSMLTRVAANDLAAAAVSGMRAGVVGVVGMVALSLALDAAREYWNTATNQMMKYPPDVDHQYDGDYGTTCVPGTFGSAGGAAGACLAAINSRASVRSSPSSPPQPCSRAPFGIVCPSSALTPFDAYFAR